MVYRVLADLLVVIHFGFVLFVCLGGFLVLRRPRLGWIHVPAAVWGGALELGGWICPLTPLESWLRRLAGGVGYRGGFIDHYLVPVLYPSGLTRGLQVLLGALVLALNGAIYLRLLVRARARR